jgi:hypothetical protein
MVHGFYAIMGGFVIDASKVDKPFLPKVRDRPTVLTSGIKVLIRHGYGVLLNDISVKEILDKSKANHLVKISIGLQTLWFCAQLVARLAQSLPISLLELNTFAHGTCTLLAIYFWWDKPQDIEEPTLIRSDHVMPICALRISCLFLICALPLTILVFPTSLAFASLLHGRARRRRGPARSRLRDAFPFLIVLLSGISLAYVFGRAYLLIECFINVAHLDERVFILPNWTNYWPHIA